MSDDTLEKVGFVLFGWLLGLLGPAIVDSIKRKRENRLGREAIRVELRQLRERLLVAAHGVDDHLGTQTKEKIRWTLERIAPGDMDDIRAALECRVNQTDEEFNAVSAFLEGKGNKTIRLQNYGTPLLDARVLALWSFSTEAQRALLELKTKMGFLEDTVAQSRYFSALTFQELSSENHRIAVQGEKEFIGTYARQAREAVELIDQFIDGIRPSKTRAVITWAVAYAKGRTPPRRQR